MLKNFVGSCKSRDITKERILEYSAMNLKLPLWGFDNVSSKYLHYSKGFYNCIWKLIYNYAQTYTHAHVCAHTQMKHTSTTIHAISKVTISHLKKYLRLP